MARLDHSDEYRKGPFAPVADEVSLEGLAIEGELPRELDGLFVKNSPNPRFEPRGRYHWFDGDGMVHGVRLQGGQARYANRYVRTKAFEKETREGRALWTGIMEPVELSNPHGPAKDTANTDVTWHAGKLLATWWLSGVPYEVSPATLETVGPVTFGNDKPVRVASHPKVCPETGELLFFDYSVVAPPYLQFGIASREGKLVRKVPIELPGPRLLHDIAFTRNHAVFLDFPMMWRTDKLGEGKRRVVFDASVPARFGVMPRNGTEVRWFEASPCYVYHTVNAWEEDGAIVFVGCRIANPLPATRTTDETTPRLDFIELVPFLHKWRFDLETGKVSEEKLDDLPSEFPRVPAALLGKKTRYAYNVRLAPSKTLLFDGIVKYDLERKRSDVHSFGAGWYGTEAVYVPRPGARDEDDGWVLSQIARGDEAQLVVLDARNVGRAPLARVKIPRRVPIGFHTTWVPGSELGR